MKAICPVCHLSYELWQDCWRGDCHDGRWKPVYVMTEEEVRAIKQNDQNRVNH